MHAQTRVVDGGEPCPQQIICDDAIVEVVDDRLDSGLAAQLFVEAHSTILSTPGKIDKSPRIYLLSPALDGLWQARDVSHIATITLGVSGYRAVIEPDRWVPGAYTLVVDGTPQSHVNLDDPGQLFFEYVQRIGHVIDRLLLPGEPLTAVHLGAGALTLPRYIEATRPGSRQQVIELESDLVDLVRENLPLPRSASIRIRHGDARAVMEKLPAGLTGAADLVVVDVFSGARTPAHVTSVEFYRAAASLLTPAGVIAINAADGPGLHFARGQAATLLSVFADVAALADTQLLKGKRFGNVVLIASPTELPLEWMPRLLAGGPHPAKVVHAQELADWVGTAPVITDATAVQSPPPSKSIFQVGNRE
jgi:spermidine synthase